MFGQNKTSPPYKRIEIAGQDQKWYGHYPGAPDVKSSLAPPGGLAANKQRSEIMSLIETIPLPNGLELTIHDRSRRIASDTVKVELSFGMKIKVAPSFFASEDDHLELVSIFGDELTYEHKLERTFVSEADESAIRAELLDTFKANSLNYLSSPDFARKMALSLLRDIRQNPFKYRRPVPDADVDD
jgi:hypothetical protein